MRFLIHVIANGIAFLIANALIQDFIWNGTTLELAITALILTMINMTIRPIIKLILSPFILLTLGTLSILINAGILYVLDILSKPLTIQGLMPLLLATLIISITNIALTTLVKK